MRRSTPFTMTAVLLVGACSTIPAPAGSAKTIHDVVLDVDGCTISADRKVECTLVVVSKDRDRIVSIGNGASLQDNSGDNHSARVRFGTDSWQKTLIANAPYQLNLTVENVSTRTTAIRAIILNTVGVSLGPNQHVGSQSQVIFANPPMKAPVATEPGAGDWQTVGFWNYDEADGKFLAEGMVLVTRQGANAGQEWKSHLQLKAHDRLPKRERSLWPVRLSIGLKQICVGVPDYPTFSSAVDFPGSDNDGIYTFRSCP